MKNIFTFALLSLISFSAFADTVTQAQVTAQKATVAADRIAIVQQKKTDLAADAPLLDAYNADMAQLQLLQAELAAQITTPGN